MISEDELKEIREILNAKPIEHSIKHGEMHFERIAEPVSNIKEVIYVRGDEYVDRDGTYLRIVTEYADVYISGEMIKRFNELIREEVEDDSLFDP